MRANNHQFRMILIASLCAAVASCSAVKQDVAVAHVPAKKVQTVKTTVATSSRAKTYAFSSSRPVAAAMQEENAVASLSESRPTYLGSAPYICTPSGFGRKAQCFLR